MDADLDPYCNTSELVEICAVPALLVNYVVYQLAVCCDSDCLEDRSVLKRHFSGLNDLLFQAVFSCHLEKPVTHIECVYYILY